MTQALSCYCRSVLITKKLGDCERCGIIYGCIGNVLHLLGNYDEAIVFHYWVRKLNEAKLVAIHMNDVQREERCKQFIRHISEIASEREIID
ncbi:hypothetical protein COOONC_24008 [Cooperia oncophora]